jgi:hypothetical protein
MMMGLKQYYCQYQPRHNIWELDDFYLKYDVDVLLQQLREMAEKWCLKEDEPVNQFMGGVAYGKEYCGERILAILNSAAGDSNDHQA